MKKLSTMLLAGALAVSVMGFAARADEIKVWVGWSLWGSRENRSLHSPAFRNACIPGLPAPSSNSELMTPTSAFILRSASLR